MIGYARISVSDQNMALQHEMLHRAGCAVIDDDKLSGTETARPGLMAALIGCRHGGVLVAWKLDRIGRSLVELVHLNNRLNSRVGLKILTGHSATISQDRAGLHDAMTALGLGELACEISDGQIEPFIESDFRPPPEQASGKPDPAAAAADHQSAAEAARPLRPTPSSP